MEKGGLDYRIGKEPRTGLPGLPNPLLPHLLPKELVKKVLSCKTPRRIQFLGGIEVAGSAETRYRLTGPL
jgi:hypothetical protein